MGDQRVLSSLEEALLRLHPDLERLSRPPHRDDLSFGDLEIPALASTLDAWFYAPADRTAYAALAPETTPGRGVGSWSELLTDHLHSPSAGRIWTPISIVAMPLLPPFDEPGLRIRPILALERNISSDGERWLCEAMVATVREGRPHVTPVSVFSAAIYERTLTPTR